MNKIFNQVLSGHALAIKLFQQFDFLGPLAIRLYLAPIFFMAGMHKLQSFDAVVSWFGDSLGLPLPALMAVLAISAELGGAICLVFGFAVRYSAIALSFTMLVAAITAHWEFGWQVVADPNGLYVNERVMASAEKLERALSILKAHGNYEWLTSSGKFVILNNGIEWAATYGVMCVVLIGTGGGRWVSADYWIKTKVDSVCNRRKAD